MFNFTVEVKKSPNNHHEWKNASAWLEKYLDDAPRNQEVAENATKIATDIYEATLKLVNLHKQTWQSATRVVSNFYTNKKNTLVWIENAIYKRKSTNLQTSNIIYARHGKIQNISLLIVLSKSAASENVGAQHKLMGQTRARGTIHPSLHHLGQHLAVTLNARVLGRAIPDSDVALFSYCACYEDAQT